MKEIRILSPTGMLGAGFFEQSFQNGIKKNPHFIAVDSGSTDPGPYSLATGNCSFPRDSVKRDLRIILQGACEQGIPLIIGSCGTAGGDLNLMWTYDIVQEIAREKGYRFKAALVHSEQNKEYLLEKMEKGRVTPLFPSSEADENLIIESDHIVGMMGTEPIIEAHENGAQVILCGRASDTSLFAALPIHWGADSGIAWHAAKILECGSACVVRKIAPDSMLCYLREDHFVIEPLHPDMRCTPQSVAAHTFYETPDPFYIQEPSGTLNTSEAEYSAADSRSVLVKGSRFNEAKRYTVKLEGAKKVGYQSLLIGGIRDPFLIQQFDSWLESLKEILDIRIKDVFGDVWCDIYPRVYGKNGVMGETEPIKKTCTHELGVIFEITAATQELASKLSSVIRHIVLHHPIPEWSGSVTLVAFPYSPQVVDRGAVYQFTLNHVVEPDNPYEMFPIEYFAIGEEEE